MTQASIFFISAIIGTLTWAICPLVSNSFEPFDTVTGLLIGQTAMSTFAIYVGWKTHCKAVFLAILGMYAAQNCYAYVFGGSELRAWFLLGLITTIVLCIYPLIAGLSARAIKIIRLKIKKRS